MAGYKKRYTQEFKDTAIQLALNSEKSTLQTAKELDICSKTLYGWLRDYPNKYNLQSNTKTTSKQASSQSLQEKNRRLHKELATLKKKEILKKAAAYFAKETM